MTGDLTALMQRIQAEGWDVSARDVRRFARHWANAADVEKALMTLERGGYGELYVKLAGPAGGRPSVRFRLFRK